MTYHLLQPTTKQVSGIFKALTAMIMLCGVMVMSSVQLAYGQAAVQLDLGDPGSLIAGQEASIPLVFSTNGQEVDGIQFRGVIEGAAVDLLDIRLNGALGLQQLRSEANGNQFAAMFLTSNPGQPLLINQPTEIAWLSFVPRESGVLTVTFNQEETLVPGHGTAQNLLGAVPSQSFSVAASQGVLTPGSAVDKYGWGLIVTSLLAVGVVFGAGYYLYRRFVKSNNPPTPKTPSTPQQQTMSKSMPNQTSSPISQNLPGLKTAPPPRV